MYRSSLGAFAAGLTWIAMTACSGAAEVDLLPTATPAIQAELQETLRLAIAFPDAMTEIETNLKSVETATGGAGESTLLIALVLFSGAIAALFSAFRYGSRS